MDRIKKTLIDLVKLLAVTKRERDDARKERDELKALLSNFLPLKQPETALVLPVDLQIQIPNIRQNNTNSHPIVSDSMNNDSETLTYSHFYADLSPENYSQINAFSTQSGSDIAASASTGSIGLPNSQELLIDTNVAMNSTGNNTIDVTDYEISDIVFDRLVEPEKVADSEPLPQTLLFAPSFNSRCAMQSLSNSSELHEIIPQYGHCDPQRSNSSLFGTTQERF